MIKGRDGKVHDFEQLHVLEKGSERNKLSKWCNEDKQEDTSFKIVDVLVV